MAFLLSETDENDVTYFIRYILKMILESIEVFDTYVKRKMKEQIEAADDRNLGLSSRQLQILNDMTRDGEPVSQYELSAKYQTPVPTIRRDLVKLVDVGLVRVSGKDGHRLLYVCVRKE